MCITHYTGSFGNGKKNVLSIAQALIDHGADINAEVNNGETPVSRAVVRENVEVLELLLKKGAKLQFRSLRGMSRPSYIHYTTKIRTTPGKSLAMAKLIIRLGVDVDIRSCYQVTALLAAAYLGNVNVVRLSCQKQGFCGCPRFFGTDTSGGSAIADASSSVQESRQSQ